ncbi:MAG: sigma 54-interacting transcriptional regulator [Rectinemataceae bacterium]
METVLYYDPDAIRRNRVKSALSSEFEIRCFASMAELCIEAGKNRHALALDGTPAQIICRQRQSTHRYRNTDGSTSLVAIKSVRLCDETGDIPQSWNDVPYLPVPDNPEELRRRTRECIRLYGQGSFDLDICLGSGENAVETTSELKVYAQSDEPLLIFGETGTGKELAARMTHHLSARSDGPYIAFNCANLTAETADSILFGSVKGGFTDALDREGLFTQADAGTLFLDEIGSLPASIQSKLLRAIEGGGFRRVGGLYTEYSNVRIVSATCEDLHERAKNGTFRRDLLYRLCILELWLPPLRERIEDIAPLAQHFCFRRSAGLCELSHEALDILTAHLWPGNVRELKSTVEKAVLKVRRGLIGPESISFAGERRRGGGIRIA